MKLIVRGRVQGVSYRMSAREEAQRLGLTGQVRNLADGSVEAIAEGEHERLEDFVDWCSQGPVGAGVEGVDTDWAAATGQFKGFQIVR